MSISDKIAEIESQMAKTQKNKATEHHLGILKAKLAKLKSELLSPKKGAGGGPSTGFDVKKSGNASVAFVGYPSVGKSTLLNALTGAKSKTAAYAFTTLTCIPGTLHYKGAQIQLLDLPGIIAGAKEGRGRGKEVLAVARNADLVLFVVEIFDPVSLNKLKAELEGVGIRLDKKPPNIVITKTKKGGVDVHFSVKPTTLNEKIVAGVLGEYGLYSAEVILRQDLTVDELIDALEGNRKYVPSLVAVAKADLLPNIDAAALKKQLGRQDVVLVSAEKKVGISELKEAIYQKLDLIRVYTKSRFEGVDAVPLMMRSGATVGEACDAIHRDLRKLFKYAQVWGKSVKHAGQKVGLSHVLQDEDVLFVQKK